MIISGAVGSPSGNAIQFIIGLPDRQLSDLLPSVPGVPETPGTPGVPGTLGIPGVLGGSSVSPGFVGSFVGAVSGPAGVAAASSSPGSGQGKAYEVTRASPSAKSAGAGWYIYGVIGGLILIGLAAFGFLKGGFKI